MARAKGRSGGTGAWRVRPMGYLLFLLAVGSSHGELIESSTRCDRGIPPPICKWPTTSDAGSAGSKTHRWTGICIFNAMESLLGNLRFCSFLTSRRPAPFNQEQVRLLQFERWPKGRTPAEAARSARGDRGSQVRPIGTPGLESPRTCRCWRPQGPRLPGPRKMRMKFQLFYQDGEFNLK